MFNIIFIIRKRHNHDLCTHVFKTHGNISIMSVFLKLQKRRSLENFNSPTMHAGRSGNVLIMFLSELNLMGLVNSQQKTRNFFK